MRTLPLSIRVAGKNKPIGEIKFALPEFDKVFLKECGITVEKDKNSENIYWKSPRPDVQFILNATLSKIEGILRNRNKVVPILKGDKIVGGNMPAELDVDTSWDSLTAVGSSGEYQKQKAYASELVYTFIKDTEDNEEIGEKRATVYKEIIRRPTSLAELLPEQKAKFSDTLDDFVDWYEENREEEEFQAIDSWLRTAREQLNQDKMDLSLL